MNATNSTTISRRWQEFFDRSTAAIAVETSILLLLGLIAIGGNLLVVISIYRNPSLRTVTNYFVLSLAFTDISYPLTCSPLTIISSAKSRFVFGQEMCDLQAICVISLSYISIITMVLMAVNRYVCVCKPNKYKKIFNRKTSLIFIAIVWVSIFVTTGLYNKQVNSLPNAVFIPDEMRCNFTYDINKPVFVILGNVMAVICIAVPFGIIIYCYYKVFKKIRHHKRSTAPSTIPSGRGTSVKEIKVTWMLLAVLIGYCVTWIPVLIVTLMANTLASWLFFPRQVRLIITFSGTSSYALNPVIYGFMNPGFRGEYVRIFAWIREVGGRWR